MSHCTAFKFDYPFGLGSLPKSVCLINFAA